MADKKGSPVSADAPVTEPTPAPDAIVPGTGTWVVAGEDPKGDRMAEIRGRISYTPIMGGAEIRAKYGDSINGADLRESTLAWLVANGKVVAKGSPLAPVVSDPLPSETIPVDTIPTDSIPTTVKGA